MVFELGSVDDEVGHVAFSSVVLSLFFYVWIFVYVFEKNSFHRINNFKADFTMMIRAGLRRGISTFTRGDVVVVRAMNRGDRLWLSEPLQEGGIININQGHIAHDDLFGVKSRNLVKSSLGNPYIVTHASTEDYINLSRRAATPIYTFDASSIVSLADIHIDFPELSEDGQLKEPPLQFFEAGTGHGSLTLAICSQIHSANCFYKTHGVRGAILHSIDRNEGHSNVGKRTVRNFRRGMYTNDVEFHIAESPIEWFDTASEWKSLDKDTDEGFLSGAFLDLPDISGNIEPIVTHMKQDSPLIVFCPSVTQILEVLKAIKDKQMKLTHIRTIQLVPGVGGGLQDWDTRFTYIRATGEEGIVCRPRVGSRMVGGGFVGVFKKLPVDLKSDE
jgi:tRNA A58 N-methylase Trm61